MVDITVVTDMMSDSVGAGDGGGGHSAADAR